MRCERPEPDAPWGYGAERDGCPPGWHDATRGGGRPSAAALRRSRDGDGGGSAWRSLCTELSHPPCPSLVVQPSECRSGHPNTGVWLPLRQVGLLGKPEAARLRGAAGEAGARERAGDVAAGAVGGRGQFGALGRAIGRRVGPEDVLLGLAGQQRLELLA